MNMHTIGNMENAKNIGQSSNRLILFFEVYIHVLNYIYLHCYI